MSAKKTTPKPVWWKNTYFAISFILFIVGVIGLPFFGGEKAIRDPGQLPDSGLVFIYWGAAVLMFANGWLSHRQTVKAYEEELSGEE